MTETGDDMMAGKTMMLVSGDIGEDGRVSLVFYDEAAANMVVVDNGVWLPYFFAPGQWQPPAGSGIDDSLYNISEAVRANVFTGEDVKVTMVRARPGVYPHLRDLATSAAKAAASGSGGGVNGDVAGVWEGNIRHMDSYYYDRGLVPGRLYEVYEGGRGGGGSSDLGDDGICPYTRQGDDGNGSGNEDNEMLSHLEKTVIPKLREGRTAIDREGFESRLRGMARTLSEPVPDIKRCAVDIEVDSGGRNPDASAAMYPITAVGIHSDTERMVLLPQSKGVAKEGDGEGAEKGGVGGCDKPVSDRTIEAANGKGMVRVLEYGDEAGMLKAAFGVLAAYPCMLTWYGDDFDIPYMFNRAARIGAERDAGAAFIRRGSILAPSGGRIHIDLWKVFSNPSLHAYAFAGKYNTFGLDAVADAMLGERKTGSGADTARMGQDELAAYCHNDARLTYELSAFSGGVVMRLLVILARLSILSVDAVSRTRVSTWIQSAIRAEHRKAGTLVPRFLDLQGRAGDGGQEDAATTAAVGRNSDEHRTKKYKGATVLEQVAGVHWGLTVLDFASLYPNIIHTRNLSYETVRCDHAECREGNPVPGTPHWYCTRRAGVLASIIGAMREMRVHYYKPLARDKSLSEERRDVLTTVEQAIKVVMNASYGVMGSDMFAMYFLPVAESTTAFGRAIISDTVEECEKRGMKVLYGDTDSLFLGRAGKGEMDAVIEAAKERHGADLEVDKQYRYAILTGRKKNYLGIREDGTFDIKGLTGKKSHTPMFVRKCFDGAIARLAEARDDAGIEEAKAGIVSDISKATTALRGGNVPIRDLLFRVKMTKKMDEYGSAAGNGNSGGNGGGSNRHSNTTITGDGGGGGGGSGGRGGASPSMSSMPQHVVAAMELQRRFGAEIGMGDVVSYIKSTRRSGVSPYECAAREDVATDKYTEFLGSTLDQLLRPLGIDAAAVIRSCGSMSMEEFFG